MQLQDLSPRWPWLLALLAANYVAAASMPLFFTLINDGDVIAWGMLGSQTIIWAVIALLFVRQRSVQLALAVLLPTLHVYALLIASFLVVERTFVTLVPLLIVNGIMSVTIAAILAGVHWLAGWSISCAEEKDVGQPVRFRLSDIAAWTTAFALPLMFARLFNLEEVAGSNLALSILNAALVLFAGLPSLMLLLKLKQLWLGILLAVALHLVLNAAFAVVVGATLYSWSSVQWRFLVLELSYLVRGFGITLVLNAVALRFLGYRWQRAE